MKIIAKRSLAWLMTLMMCVTLFCGVWTPAQAATVNYVTSGKYIYNWGTREEVATFLSPMAEEWYEKNNTTYAELSAMSGSSSTSSVPSSALYQALHELMYDNLDNATSYDGTRDLYQYTDVQNSGKDTKKISSFYSGDLIGPSWDSGKTWNREHVWPNSKSNSGSGSSSGREADIMMLRPTATSENGSRGNKAYGESSDFYHPNSESSNAHDLRGDVSRIVLYVYVCWGGSDKADGALSYMWGKSGVMESLSVLLKWVEEDPVDTWELGRNDAVEAITGTRNVFVDYPELVFALFNQSVPADYQSPSGEGANGSGDCQHNLLACGATCPECGTYVKQHVFRNSCVKLCANGCGTANPDYTGHVYSSEYDATCDVCNEARTVNYPAAGSVLSIADAIAIGSAMEHNTTTSDKYYITGTIVDVSNTTYGNMNIQDAAGNKIYVYGTYDATGTNRYDAMANQPTAGMTITLYTVVGNYNGPQLKNAWITDTAAGCDHVFDSDCDADCNKNCGYVREPQHKYVEQSVVAATCTKTGTATYKCSACGDTKTETIATVAHKYVNGACSVCGTKKPTDLTPVTDASQLVSGQYVLVVDTGYAPTHLDGTWVLCGQPTITGGVIAADDATDYLWTLTVDGDSVKLQDANGTYVAPKGGNTNGIKSGEYSWTWTFADGQFVFAGVGEDTVYLASNTDTNASYGGFNKFRGYKTTTASGDAKKYPYQFTLYTVVGGGESACDHADAHDVAAKDPTCAVPGYTAGVYCPDCDEYISGHTEVPATGEHTYDNACDADCNVCGTAREVEPHTYDNACDADCNVCGDTREVEPHTYDNACDATCNVCGDIREVAPHAYESVVTTTPTCGADGVRTYTCAVCGDSYTAVEPATGEHTYDNVCDADCNTCGTAREVAPHTYESVVTTAPTCGADGLRTYICAVCGDSYTAVEPATGEHTYDNACDAACNACGTAREVAPHAYESVVTTAPTCGADGLRTYTCAVCGDSYTAVEPATGKHTYDNTCDATCNECDHVRVVGPHKYDNVCDTDCNVCGTVRTTPDHVYQSAVTTLPTCGTEGVRTYTCIICAATYTEAVRPTGLHIYDHGCDADCNGCDHVREVAPHSYKNACDADCNVCGALREVQPHAYDNACDADCNVCGAVRVPAAHAYDNACDADCNVCGATREVGDHTYESAVTTAPTCTVDGVRTYTCSACGHSYTEAIPAGHTYDNAYDADCNVCGDVREVTATVRGDANGDGALDMLDVGVMQRYLNGWDVSVHAATADMDGNGVLNNRDLVLLMRLLAGWNV